MKAFRIVLSLIVAGLSAICIGVALTVPMIVATTPAIFGIVLAVVAFLLWPRKKKLAA